MAAHPDAGADQPRKALPHPYSGQSYLDSVVGFIQNIPKAVGKPPPKDAGSQRERLLWARFDESGVEPPRPVGRCLPFLVLGYEDGVQVWDVRDAQAVTEVASWRKLSVCCAKVLTAPNPLQASGSQSVPDRFAASRPLFAFCKASSGLSSKSTVQVVALNTHTEVFTIEVRGKPLRIESNSHVVCVVLHDRIALYSSATLELLHTIQGCFTSKSVQHNPTALGPRWLAYATSDSLQAADVQGGIVADPGGAMGNTAAVVAAVQRAGSKLYQVGGQGVKTMSDMINGVNERTPTGAAPKVGSKTKGSSFGVVKVVDVTNPSRVVAHFRAHTTAAVTCIAFDPSGTIVVTACTDGQFIHVFSLAKGAYEVSRSRVLAGTDSEGRSRSGSTASAKADTSSSSLEHIVAPTPANWRCRAVHMFTLCRGATVARVCGITLSGDSRWVAVTSHRGTTHLYPINPRGESVDVRTHVSVNVPNLSQFHASAGVAELQQWRERGPLIVGGAMVQLKNPATQTSKGRQQAEDADVVVCFGSLTSEIEAQTAELKGAKAVLLTLMLCTPNGDLVEHKMQPYGPGEKRRQAAAAATTLHGGTIIAEGSGIIDGVVSSVGSMFNSRQAGGGDDSPQRTGVDKFQRIGLACAATRVWDLCRRQDWKVTSRRLSSRQQQPSEQGQQEMGEVAQAVDPPVATHYGDDEMTWLSAVDMQTYQAPHRRLWMGPQFAFSTFEPLRSHHQNTAAVLSPTRNQMAGVRSTEPAPVFATQHQFGLKPVPLVIKSRQATKEVYQEIPAVTTNSPWPQPPSREQLSDNYVRTEMAFAMSNTAGPGNGSSGSSSDDEDEDVDAIFKLDDFEPPSDTDWGQQQAAQPPTAELLADLSSALDDDESPPTEAPRAVLRLGDGAQGSSATDTDRPVVARSVRIPQPPLNGVMDALRNDAEDPTLHRVHSNVSMMSDVVSDELDEAIQEDGEASDAADDQTVDEEHSDGETGGDGDGDEQDTEVEAEGSERDDEEDDNDDDDDSSDDEVDVDDDVDAWD
eukprot:m.15536 g.15536  ORF g.15536 m.15536 type:complete len:1030 (+) comp5044_c0_seq1:275-3364(+)